MTLVRTWNSWSSLNHSILLHNCLKAPFQKKVTNVSNGHLLISKRGEWFWQTSKELGDFSSKSTLGASTNNEDHSGKNTYRVREQEMCDCAYVCVWEREREREIHDHKIVWHHFQLILWPSLETFQQHFYRQEKGPRKISSDMAAASIASFSTLMGMNQSYREEMRD